MAIYQGLVPNVNPLAQAIIGMGERKRADDQMRMQQQEQKEAANIANLLTFGDSDSFMLHAQELYNGGQFDGEDYEELIQIAALPKAQRDQFLSNMLTATGYGDLVPKNLRGDFQSPKVQRSVVFKDGSNLTIMNDGTRRVTSPTGDIVEGQAAVDVINAGNESGIAYTGQEAFTRSSQAEAGKEGAQTRAEYIKLGRSAYDMMKRTQRLLDLNEQIRTGGFESARKRVADFFGVTDADEGLFNAEAGKLILDNIRALGANPTEGERAFLAEITPSIRQGKKVNRAILENMLEVQKRNYERAKWLAANPKASVDDYFFMTESEDFTPRGDLFVEDTAAVEGYTPREKIEIPLTNQRGWRLQEDANGNRAYVSPDGTQFEEVK